MIDTVSLTQPMTPRLSERQLMKIGAVQPRGQTQWVINPQKGQVFPSLTFTTIPTGVQYMIVRQSLPRLRNWHNATLQTSLNDIYAELGLLANAIYERTRLEFDPLTASVNSVDFTRDMRVGHKLVTPTLKRLEQRQLLRHERIRFDHAVKFQQKGGSSLIYSKYHEIHGKVKKGTIPLEYRVNALQAAHGVLRIESRLTRASLERLRHKGICKTRQAKDVLTPDISEHVISKVLHELRFDDTLNDTQSNTALDRLIEVYGSRSAMQLYGFLVMADLYGNDFWKLESLKYSKSTYSNNLRKCREAGVWEV